MNEKNDTLYSSREMVRKSMYEIVICDDDTVFCYELEDFLTHYSEEQNLPIDVHIFHTGPRLEEYIAEGKVPLDILFLDIELNNKQRNGVDIGNFLRTLPDAQMTQIVFVSSKTQYAMQLFQIQPLDFLQKPISQKKIDRVMSTYVKQFIETNAFFKYSFNKRECHVQMQSILYFQSTAKQIRIVTKHGEIEYYGKLSNALKQLPKNLFLSVHKSYIVNMSYVSECRGDELLLPDNVIIPISQSKRENVHKYIRERTNMDED